MKNPFLLEAISKIEFEIASNNSSGFTRGEFMIDRHRWTVGIGCCMVLLLLIGCASTQKCHSQKVPVWLTSTPYDDSYFYAVGISGQTRKASDAWIQAGNRGRAELGRIIFSHVSSQDTIINTSRGQYSSQLIDILSDTDLNYTEIIERWHDRCGDYGSPHHYYVLLRMKKETAATILRRLTGNSERIPRSLLRG